MTHIPDAAVQAALEYYSEGGCMGLDSYERKEVAKSMLEAALPYLRSGLPTNPVDVAAVLRQGYRQGLETAAKWHEDHAIGYETEYSNLNISDELAAEHRGSATAIRSFSDEPVQGEP